MPDGRNYLLGKGENLTSVIDPGRGGGPKYDPYSFAEAKAALVPKVNDASRALDELQPIACPEDQAVAVLTLHPAYLAKSYFPAGLLAAAGLRTVGSRPATIVPRKPSSGAPAGAPLGTTELFIAGPRRRFRAFAGAVAGWDESSDGAAELIRIEDFRAPRVEERIRPPRSDSARPLMEVALHGAGLPVGIVLAGFRAFLDSLGVDLEVGRPLEAGPLLFLPVRIPRETVQEIGRFAFLRVAREMPALRLLRPQIRVVAPEYAPRPCRLPVEGPLDPGLTAATFDGGMPAAPDLGAYVRTIDAPGVGPPVQGYQEHGLAVSSALLFGSIDDGRGSGVPYARIDHYRVLDEQTRRDPNGELYPVLERIVGVLRSHRYGYVNISIGPDQPIEDDEVGAWTALLDPLLARGDTLAAVAAGNSGELDAEAGLNRIQPPADCVNALAVGSCRRGTLPYARAPYSSIGPGRSPGRVKPDVVAFGGTRDDPYWVLGPGPVPHVVPAAGTSLASPTALRAALGIRAHLGPELRPLTVRALLIHRGEENYRDDRDLIQHDRAQFGWGRVQSDMESLLTCPDDTVHVVYQGFLQPRQFLRAPIPVPTGEIPGLVFISATICIGCATDAEHPSNYTRSGIEVRFRPHVDRRGSYLDRVSGERRPSSRPKSRPFFVARPYMSEGELREDAHKWETTLCAFDHLQGRSLSDPVFELHHNPRLGGCDAIGDAIPYAMIVTVQAPEVKDLYNRVFLRYKGRLEPLVPVIDISLST